MNKKIDLRFEGRSNYTKLNVSAVGLTAIGVDGGTLPGTVVVDNDETFVITCNTPADSLGIIYMLLLCSLDKESADRHINEITESVDQFLDGDDSFGAFSVIESSLEDEDINKIAREFFGE